MPDNSPETGETFAVDPTVQPGVPETNLEMARRLLTLRGTDHSSSVPTTGHSEQPVSTHGIPDHVLRVMGFFRHVN